MTKELDLDWVIEEARAIFSTTNDNETGWCAQTLIEVAEKLQAVEKTLLAYRQYLNEICEATE